VTKRSVLQAEIKQTRPFRSTAHEAAVGLLRTADVVRRRFAAVIAPSGVTPQQYNVLRILRGAGADGLPTLEIAERMVENTPGITRLIDRLEAVHLVERERSTEDRRAVFCRVTKKGLIVLAGLDDAVDAANDAALAMLPERSKKELVRLLDAVREGAK